MTHQSTVTFDLLWHRVQVTFDSEAVGSAIEPLVQHARQPIDPVATMDLAIRTLAPSDRRRGSTRYEVLDRGDQLAVVDSPLEAGHLTFERVQRRAFELASRKGWLRVHGAVLHHSDQRIAVVGHSGVGKSTLTLTNAALGHTTEADESFLTREGTVLAVPRRFHCEADIIELVPDLAHLVGEAPLLEVDPPVVAIDPATIDSGWATESAPLDLLAVLVDPGADPSRRLLSSAEALPYLLHQAFPTIETKAAVLERVIDLTRSTTVIEIKGSHRLSPRRVLALIAGD